MGKKKSIILTIVAVTVLLVSIVGATYAYFTASVTNFTKVTTTAKTSSRDVFIVSGSTTLNTEVTNAFMSENSSKDDYSVSISKYGTITVSLTAGSNTASCYYDLAISNSGSVAYTKSPDLGGLFEYTVQGVDDRTQSFDEINVDDAISSTISATPADDLAKQVSSGILGNFFIMDSYDKGDTQSATVQTWTITTKFYNLNKLQNAQENKKYLYDVKVVNVHCTNSWPIKPIIVGNGTLNDVGTEAAIGDEHFYVISSDDDTITILAKYNLLVGNVYDSSGKLISTYDGTEEGYGLQSKDTKESVKTASQYIGTVPFASTAYWTVSKTPYTLLSSYGTSYPAWVYDDNASIKGYVDNYKYVLEDIYGLSINEARLIKHEELEDLGCDSSSKTCNTSTVTNNNRQWIYNTAYWTGSAGTRSNIFDIYWSGKFNNTPIFISGSRGVRPVITISKDLF